MSNSNNQIPYDIKHIILYSPFEHRSDRRWPGDDSFVQNKDEFIKYCYAEPCFDKKEKLLREELMYLQKQITSTRSIERLNEEIKQVSAKRLAKSRFEKSLDTTSDNPIYIRGFAGTGKSTYMNTLLVKKEQDALARLENVSFELYDMTQSTKKVTFLSYNWINHNFVATLYKFISVLMTRLNEILEKKMEDTEDMHRQRMKCILDNYYNYIFNCGMRIYTEVFLIIEEYLKNKIKYNTSSLSDVSTDTFCYKMFNAINSYCPQENANLDDVDKSIDQLLELSIILLFCSHDKKDIQSKKFKHFIFFDNIENFIKNHVVYNKDINDIARIMHQFVDSLTERFNRIGNADFNFSQHFKIILAIRDTTEKIIDEIYLQDEGHSKIQLDVSTWFSLDEILEKKLKYFKSKGIIPYSIEQSKIVKYIFEDTTYSEKGLGNVLSQMYNYNKRRIIIYTTTILEKHPDCGVDYLNLWETAKSYDQLPKSKKVNRDLVATYKNAARQIIIRLLLDYIEETDYFEAINTIREDRDTPLGSGFARKTLTYLYRRVPLNIMEDEVENLGYIGFNTLLREVLVSPCNPSHHPEEYRSQIDILARILYKMNSSSEDSTHWCQLVIIKFKQETFDPDVLADKMYTDFVANNDDRAYGVKITDAGRYFVEGILPNFEYFACRYAKQSSPLFTRNNLTITSKLPVGYSNVAIELQKKVSEQVFRCIDAIIHQDMNFFTTNETPSFDGMYSIEGCPRRYCYEPPSRSIADYGNEQCHPLRIINNHIRYLDNYRAYILTLKNKDGYYYYNEETRKGLSITILKVIKSYINKLNDILNDKIGENGTIITGASYVGNVNVENEQKYAKVYLTKCIQAEKLPLDFTIRIERNYEK